MSDFARDKLTALILVLGLLVVYNLNFRHGNAVDTVPNTVLPASIITNGSFYLDDYRELLEVDTRALEMALYFGTVQERDGRLLSSYPVGAAILSIPVYAVAFATGYLDDWHSYLVVGKLSAALMTALSAAILYLCLRLYAPYRESLIVIAFYALGTTAWSVVSQEQWQHASSMLCLSIALYSLGLMEIKPSARLAFLAGLALALAVSCRSLNVIPAVALSLFLLCRHRSFILVYTLPLLLIACLLIYYNLTRFDSISGGYSAIYSSKWHAWRSLTPETAYTTPLLKGLLGILISPSKGLFIYSPFLIFSLIAIPYLFRRSDFPLFPYLIIWIVGISALLAKNTLWWGGTAYGPRYFSEALLPLSLIIAASWPLFRQYRLLAVGFLLLGGISVLIHLSGAFLAPCGWADEPVWSDMKPERHWDWSDPEILRCINRALDEGPLEMEILNYQQGAVDHI